MYRVYDLQGDYQQYTLGGEATELGVIDAHIYDNGLVAMIGNLTLLEVKGWEGGKPLVLANPGASPYLSHTGRSQCALAQVYTSLRVHGRSSPRTLQYPDTSKCYFPWTRPSTLLTISRMSISGSRGDRLHTLRRHLTARAWHSSPTPDYFGWFRRISSATWRNSTHRKWLALMGLSGKSSGARTMPSSSRGMVWPFSSVRSGIHYSEPHSFPAHPSIQRLSAGTSIPAPPLSLRS